RWVATSHNRAVPSASPVASVLPSGLNATEPTAPAWPARAGSCRGGATNHNRAVPSAAAGARVWPSGLDATGATPPARRGGAGVNGAGAGGAGGAGGGGVLRGGAHIPHRGRAIGAPGGRRLAVGADRHREPPAGDGAADRVVGG